MSPNSTNTQLLSPRKQKKYRIQETVLPSKSAPRFSVVFTPLKSTFTCSP